MTLCGTVAFNIYKALSFTEFPTSYHTTCGRPSEGNRRNQYLQIPGPSGKWMPALNKTDSNWSLFLEWWWLLHFASFCCWLLRSTPAIEGDWILLATRQQDGREAKPWLWSQPCLLVGTLSLSHLHCGLLGKELISLNLSFHMGYWEDWLKEVR